MGQGHLNKARSVKNDEFYTKYEDVENGILPYRKWLANKVVYCSADTIESNFFKYFKDNFQVLRLKKLICTSFKKCIRGVRVDFDGNECKKTSLKGDGDFRNVECLEIMKGADVVITNPPFSLLESYLELLEKYKKKFLIVIPLHFVSSRPCFFGIKENRMSITPFGKKKSSFVDGNGEIRDIRCYWLQNIFYHEKPFLKLTKKYNPKDYPKYHNLNAIEVSKVANIPIDYDGLMGVPINFVEKYNPNQFEIVAREKYWGAFPESYQYKNPKIHELRKRHKNDKTFFGEDFRIKRNYNFLNEQLTRKLESEPDGTYRSADCTKYLKTYFARYVIKHKEKKT